MELLLFALVLAITAAIVVPQYTRADVDHRMLVLRTRLAAVRGQIQRYAEQHGGAWPNAEMFAAQMTGRTDVSGLPLSGDSQGRQFGPYLQQIPVNPYTGGNVVSNGPVGSSDWFYEPRNGYFTANHSAEARGY
jgi:type II secretory pathway pseudopilin PulG